MARKRSQRGIVRPSVTLQHAEPKAARRMDVPSATHLDDLRLYIQAATGWDNDHAWGFDARRYGKRARRGPGDWGDALGETLPGAIAFLKGRPEFAYVYDCGDRWEHRIRTGRIQPARGDRRCPHPVSGTGRCPLEDIGGVPGCEEFQRASGNPNPAYRECFPDPCTGNAAWDPEDADPDAGRSRLAQFAEQGCIDSKPERLLRRLGEYADLAKERPHHVCLMRAFGGHRRDGAIAMPAKNRGITSESQ